MIYQWLEPAVKAYDKLDQFQVNGTIMTPETYHDIILAITGDRKKALNAQAELALHQMPD